MRGYGWPPSRRSLLHSLLWCLVLLVVAQLLLYRSLTNGRPSKPTGKVAHGRVVITGGGGNIGKHITQRLLSSSTPVTIVDHIFYPNELGLSDVASNPLLTVHIGDIRNTTLLSSVFTSDVVGVVHLAGISRVVQCEENPRDCTDVNKRGTQLVLDSLEHLNRQDQGKRWFVLASSIEVYGDAMTSTPREDAPTNPSSVYGVSKLATETTVETRIRNMESSGAVGTLHAVSLRLSHVYGGLYDHDNRLIPSIVTQALWNLVIQVSGGQQTLDLLHIEDCVDAFLLAIQRLTGVSSPRTHGRRAHSTFEVFNVASGHAISVSRLVDNVVHITQSKSPIRNIPSDARFSHIPVVDVRKTRRQLGFQASINVERGLDMTLRMYLRHFEGYFSRRITASCGTPSPIRSLNAQLEKLDGCTTRIHMDDQGRLVSLSAPSRDEPHWRVDDEILGATVYIKASPRKNAEGKPTFQIQGNDNGLYLGVKNPSNGSVSIGPITESDIQFDPSVHADWEIEVNPNANDVKLTLAGTNLQLAGPTQSGERVLHLLPSTKSPPWPFRISPICCSAPGPWPFTADDPVDFSLEYQRESTERPFLASPREALCTRLEAARERARGKLTTLSSSSHWHRKPQHDTSDFAADWTLGKLPACSNLCEETTICVDTGDCQCVYSTCVHRRRSPFSISTHGDGVSYPHRTLGDVSLAEAVKQTSWRDLILPLSLRFIDAGVPYPRIHVAPLSPTNKAYVESLDTDVGRLQGQACFSADAQLERGVARMGMRNGDAEMTFVPIYLARFPKPENYFEQYDYVKEHVQGFDPRRVVIPFTQDWGQCMTFMWNIWLFREQYGLAHPAMVRNTTAWSVMGDLNSICYRPHQDVIIPPRTCVSAYLVESFGDVSYVRPSRDRRVLATFHGSMWGTGAHTRARIQCSRYGWAHTPEHRLHPAGPALSTIWGGTGDYNYMGVLNDTVFCPQPAGTTGWSTRLIDAFYVGCIPVFFGHTKHFPFSDILDWSKISVTLGSYELSYMEDVLFSRYSLEDIEQLQRNILAIRHALMYPLDDIDTTTVQRQLLDERGPLFFALQSTRMKLMTKWPV